MIYRDAAHAIARVMSIETIDGTQKADWQRHYSAGFVDGEAVASPCQLTTAERLAQDSMTRSRLHKELPPVLWAVVVAKYSINKVEVIDAVRFLVPRVVTPAHQLFRMKSVTAWAIPQKKGQKGAKRTTGLPDSFYDVNSWDTDGTPESTLRRWRQVTNRWLEQRVDEAFKEVSSLLEQNGLLQTNAA